MNNPFAGLNQKTTGQTGELLLRKVIVVDERKQKRSALYAQYNLMVNEVLDLLIAAFRPGAWKKGSDCDHEYCCHCRWYAGPEEPRRAPYSDHTIRRRLVVELEVDAQCSPTGFKVLNYDNLGKCVRVGLGQNELVHAIEAVFR